MNVIDLLESQKNVLIKVNIVRLLYVEFRDLHLSALSMTVTLAI